MTSTHTRSWRNAAGAIALFVGLVSVGYPAEGKKAKPKSDVYPLDYCVVTGQKLGSMGAPVIYNHEGREIRFCCKGCIKAFQSGRPQNAAQLWTCPMHTQVKLAKAGKCPICSMNLTALKTKSGPAAWLEKIDNAVVKQQRPHYPVNTCVVTGQKLGSMGKPIDHVYRNRLVRFCCKGCVAGFTKAPGKYLAKLDKAVIEKQGKAYPLETCVVLGTKLGSMGKPVDYVAGNRLVRFCCKGCVKAFEKEPTKYLAKLDAAWKSEGHGEGGDHDSDATHQHEEAPSAMHGENSSHGHHGGHGGHQN